MKKFLSASALIGILTGAAYAGAPTYNGTVNIFSSHGLIGANGTVDTVRLSPDASRSAPHQHIGCTITVSKLNGQTQSSASCSAERSDGTVANCIVNDPSLTTLAEIAAINRTSYISFDFTPDTPGGLSGTCLDVYINNDSNDL